MEYPRNASLAIKGVFDRLAAAFLLIVLSPIFAVLALLIYLQDRGPVFFLQTRVGKDEKLFTIYKFRSMIVNADKLLDQKEILKSGKRVTKIGVLLRKTSLDEIPQLINVLLGEMSFVGPRPMLAETLPRLTMEQKKRLRMKPGITGLATVSGRNLLKWSKRIELDNQYIDNFHLGNDVIILLKTVRVALTGEGVVLDRNCDDVDDLGPVSTEQTSPDSERKVA